MTQKMIGNLKYRLTIGAILLSIVVIVAIVSAHWATLTAPNSNVLLFLVDNIVQVISFIALLFTIIGIQIIRMDMREESKRFEAIERELVSLRKSIDDNR